MRATAEEDRLAKRLAVVERDCARLRKALEGVLSICRDRAAFVAQGPRAFAQAEQIAAAALVETAHRES